MTLELGEVFEEHKKFILGVAIAAVAFLIVDRIVADDAEATTRKADGIVRDLQRDAYPTNSDLQRAARVKGELEKRLEETARRVAYVPAEGFDIEPTARDADLQYNALFRRVSEEELRRNDPLPVVSCGVEVCVPDDVRLIGLRAIALVRAASPPKTDNR